MRVVCISTHTRMWLFFNVNKMLLTSAFTCRVVWHTGLPPRWWQCLWQWWWELHKA